MLVAILALFVKNSGYVANFDSNSVSVINTDTNSVIATIPVGTQPVGLDVAPSGRKLYIANFGSNSISVVDTGNNTVFYHITVGTTPYAYGAPFIGPLVAPSPPAYLVINGTSYEADDYTSVNNPVRMHYLFPSCNHAELSLAMRAPAVNLPWSFLDTSLSWQPLPADLSKITPFLTFYADNGILSELFSGTLPQGDYEIILICDSHNGHLDLQQTTMGQTLIGLYAHRKVRVR